MSKLCPKCKSEWPDSIKYCICGEKLDLFGFEEIFGDDIFGIKEAFTKELNKRKNERNEAK